MQYLVSRMPAGAQPSCTPAGRLISPCPIYFTVGTKCREVGASRHVVGLSPIVDRDAGFGGPFEPRLCSRRGSGEGVGEGCSVVNLPAFADGLAVAALDLGAGLVFALTLLVGIAGDEAIGVRIGVLLQRLLAGADDGNGLGVARVGLRELGQAGAELGAVEAEGNDAV